MKILYLHGFNSSSNSSKAQIFKNSEFVKNLKTEIILPNLPVSPKEAIEDILKILENSNFNVSILGSSLGGFYATYFSDTYNLKSVNINPVVPNHLLKMKSLIGKHQNFQTRENYYFTKEMYDFLNKIKIKNLNNPLNHLSFIQLEDEVLNHFDTIYYYRNSHLCLESQGSHKFNNFESKIPYILDFLI